MTDADYPWRDESLLRNLYWKQELSTTEIADKLGCTQPTVSKWMQRLGIPRRNPREAAPNRRRHPAVFTDRGYVICASNYRGTTDSIGIHRLVMVAERGFEAVADKHSTTANQMAASTADRPYISGHETKHSSETTGSVRRAGELSAMSAIKTFR